MQYTGNPRSRIERWPSESARWHSMHTRVVREKDFDVIVSSLQPPRKTVKITQPVYNSTYTGRPSWLFVGKLWNVSVRRGWNDRSGSGDRKREWERKRSRVYCPRKNCHRAYTIHIYISTVAPVSYSLVMVGISPKNTAIFRSPLRAVNAALGLYRCTQRAAIMVAFQF